VETVIDVRHGAFPGILADIAPETTSLVVADPPWNDRQAWSDIGQFAARALKPHGIVLAYIGNRWCFEALDLMSVSLHRVRLAYLPASHESPWDPEVKCQEVGSFMAILSKGEFDPPAPWSTVVEGEVKGQRWHRFQRPLANVRHYVEAFTRPGELVVDPFVGSGTTAVACAQLGRNFVGCDVVEENVRATLSRLDMLRDGTVGGEAT
jgi:hypothetical protein